MRIHPAGYRTILFSVLILLIINILLFLFLPIETAWNFIFIVLTLVLIVLIIRFFRYPIRKPSCQGNDIVLASADGVVVAVEQVKNDIFFKGTAIQISTFMSPFNVHLNWVPIDAKAEEIVYFQGKHLFARKPKSSMLNEMVCFLFKTEKGHKIVVKQIAGIVARRILPFLKSGNSYKKGDELGFIRFGSRVDVLLPSDAQVYVKIGEKVKGLETTIAKLK